MQYRILCSIAFLIGPTCLPSLFSHAEPAPISFSGVAGAAFSPVDQSAIADLLFRWVATQNAGDFAGYGALYGAAFEGVRRSADRERIMRLSEWLKDRKRMFKKPMTVGMDEVYLTNVGLDAQVDFTQNWSSGGFADFGPKRLVLAKEAQGFRIRREDMLASIPIRAGVLVEIPKSKDVPFVVIAGLYPTPDAAATALETYNAAGFPSHNGYPKVQPARDFGISAEGFALLVGAPRDQQVGALLAGFITQLGTPTFIWRTENPAAENLYLVCVAPHRVDLSLVPALKRQLGRQPPPLHWEARQTCDGCGLIAPQGRSVSAKDNSVVIPYLIDQRMDRRGAIAVPDFPESVLKDKNDWEDCGHDFSWKDAPSPRFDVGKETVIQFKPVVLRLEVNQCGD
jgi:hypothetical protein